MPLPKYLALGILFAAILGLFGPALFQDKSFAMRDAAHFYHPLFEWTTQEWRAGWFPLWNPHENCGVPLLADASSSLLYPGKLLFLIPIDFVWLYKIYVVAHVVLAAAGIYRLCRVMQTSAAAATLGAVAYACGGNVAFQHCNVVFLVGAAWLPWSLQELVQLHDATQKGRVLCVARLAMILAMMVLGGDPQMAYHVLLMQGIWVALVFFCGVRKTTAAEDRLPNGDARFTGWREGCFAFGIAAAGMLGLAAVQFLPSAEAASRSDRACYRDPRTIWEAAPVWMNLSGTAKDEKTSAPDLARGMLGVPEAGMHHERLYDFSIGPWRWIEFVWPNIGGRMFPTQRRWLTYLPAESRTWTPTLYLGILPLLLGVLGAWSRKKERNEQWLAVAGIWFLLGSLGWYGFGWLVREVCSSVLGQDSDKLFIGGPVGGVYWFMVTFLPSYVGFRYPAKLMVIAVAVLSVLAAKQFDRMLDEAEDLSAVQRWSRRLIFLSLLLAAVLWVFWKKISQQFLPADLTHGPFDWKGMQWDVFSGLLQTSIVLVLLLRWLSAHLKNPTETLGWKLAGLTAVELVIANAWMVPLAPADIWRQESVVMQEMKQVAGSDAEGTTLRTRFYRGNLMGWRPIAFRRAGSEQRMAEVTAWDHESLFPKFSLGQGGSAVFSYGSIKPVDFESFFAMADQYGPKQPTEENGRNWIRLPHPAPLRMIGTEFIVAPRAAKMQYENREAFATPIETDVKEKWPADVGLWKLNKPGPRAWVVREVTCLPTIEHVRTLKIIDERTKEVLFPRGEGESERRPLDFLTKGVVETDDASVASQLSELNVADNTAATSEVSDSCEVIEYLPNRVRWKAALVKPGLLVMNDAYDPSWQAKVLAGKDAEQDLPKTVPVLRVNRILRGIYLPAGEHEVLLQYRPASLVRGATISGISWAALLLVLAIQSLWRRR